MLSSVKNFTVPLALYNGPITSTNKFGFTITVPTTTPPTARTLAIMDPGGPASFGLSLGSATINGPTSVSAGNCASSTKAIANVTTNNTLILTPQSSLSSYKGLAADAYVNATGSVTLEVCNPTTGTINPNPVVFNIRAF